MRLKNHNREQRLEPGNIYLKTQPQGAVINYAEGVGGATKWEGRGQVKFYSYKKEGGGGGTSFSHAVGGHNKF